MMVKVKITSLEGSALEWAVENAVLKDRISNEEQRASIARRNIRVRGESGSYLLNKSLGWSLVEPIKGLHVRNWLESADPEKSSEVSIHNYEGSWIAFGPTALIAGLRCFVRWKLGDEVEVPEELL